MLTSTITNVQTNALSTLAALATSGELIPAPVTAKQPPTNVNGNAKLPIMPLNQEAHMGKTKV